ncbi:stress response regulator Gls24 [Oenococcus oeni]|uniref:Asp23/Gls24 family envelope stress response protein n=1 Tax=Oenococcus oeni TaxID=1247 RepID=UPI0008F91021|nr:Asp23/Gls24 family envelope stress response protein [Oenococcus oeni]OIL37132.1 stress response regulator Gls24 [Oenococcus oeni]OIM24622.1 stress response regulator Gls24 [Oenococcus oeni]OLQ40847.1 stress response regulator Gls24 [Oenococcus oeni]
MDTINKHKETGPQQTSKTTAPQIRGALSYDDKVIQKIVGLSIGQIDGLLTVDGGFFSNIAEKLINTNNKTTGVDVEVGKKQVAVDLSIVAEYGKNIAEIYQEIKKVISKQVNQMTELEVVEVNVNVTDIKTREQYEKDSVSLQDKASEVAENTGKAVSEQSDKVSDKVQETVRKTQNRAKDASKPRVE